MEGQTFQKLQNQIMSVAKRELVNNEIYHLILRGVGDSLIFRTLDDYFRGIFSIYEFNNTCPVDIWLRRKERKEEKILEALEGQTFQNINKKRDFFVEIIAFCFMPNHIHLLAKQVKDDGISQFMKKVGTGYATYFNKKYKRKGHLFQNRFKSVLIKNEEQLKTVFVYIHTNPISLICPNWKEKGIEDVKRAIEFLENYKWSSYGDYIGKKNFPSVTEREFITKVIGGQEGCKKFIDNWIKYKKEINSYSGIEIG